MKILSGFCILVCVGAIQLSLRQVPPSKSSSESSDLPAPCYSNSEEKLVCNDDSSWPIKLSGGVNSNWNKCGTRGGRKLCPKHWPYMCHDHWCKTTPDHCTTKENGHGGLKPCEPCTCANGVPLVGDVCPAAKCESCNDQYKLKNESCIGVCTCENGDAAEGDGCPGAKCVGCNKGYYLKDDACVENVCICKNGDAGKGADCFKNDEKECVKCNPGYHLNVVTCDENLCTCDHGTPTAGVACPADGAPKCLSCDTGYHMDGEACVENVCTCANGSPVVSPECDVDKAAKCASCETGFHLDGVACPENVCTCANGVGATAAACPTDKSAKCASCKTGYDLVDDGCQAGACNSNPTEELTCMDGTSWKIAMDGGVNSNWGKCGTKGGRKKCPSHWPYMCHDKFCKKTPEECTTADRGHGGLHSCEDGSMPTVD